jgi:hypothetical protein
LQRDAVVLRQKRGFLSLAEFHDVPPKSLGWNHRAITLNRD